MAKYKASFFAEPIRAEASWTKMHPFSFESSFLAISRKQADKLAEAARLEYFEKYGRYYDIRLRSVEPVKPAPSKRADDMGLDYIARKLSSGQLSYCRQANCYRDKTGRFIASEKAQEIFKDISLREALLDGQRIFALG